MCEATRNISTWASLSPGVTGDVSRRISSCHTRNLRESKRQVEESELSYDIIPSDQLSLEGPGLLLVGEGVPRL